MLFEQLSEIQLAYKKLETGKALKRLYETSTDFKKVMTALLEEKPLELLYRLPVSDNVEDLQKDLEALSRFKVIMEQLFVDADIAEADLKEYLVEEEI